MKFIKRYNEDLEWEFEDEEFNDDLDLPIELRKIDSDDFKELTNKLKVGDRFVFSFINKKINGTIRFVEKTYYKKPIIGIEFDDNINGHDGGRYFKGKDFHCWFFYHDNNYNLKIIKRV